MPPTRFFSLLFFFGAAIPLAAIPVTVNSPSGASAAVDSESGHYSVELPEFHWRFAGGLSNPTGPVTVSEGSDKVGPYHQVAFAAGSAGLSGFIRVYDQQKAVLFSVTAEKALPSNGFRFPDFNQVPADLSVFSYREDTFGPFSFTAEQNGTPWLLFNRSGKAAVLSPASHAMIASMSGDAKTKITSGLNPGVAELPKGFSLQTLFAFGSGINATWDEWGQALVRLNGKTVPANDADIGLKYLGYWTDQGASYYYRYDAAKGYAGTIVDVVRHYRERQIPIRYLQLDSWWYYKTFTDPFGKEGKARNPSLPEGEWNRYGGTSRYVAHPFVMPDGLEGFQKEVNLPLITHNRWVDVNSPDRKNYAISGVAAVDPRWWANLIGYISNAGVVCYEQDWLNIIYDDSAELKLGLEQGDRFTDTMAQAAKDKHLSVQYSMVLPRHLIQSTRYSNVTTVRVSIDRFGRPTWDTFLFGSRFAKSVGAWPWTDVFLSTEIDNLTISTLSGGMVGIGDQKGAESRSNLLLAARPDGVLVKPDSTLVPADAVYQNETDPKHLPPMVAWTFTDHGSRRTAYVFVYGRRQAATEEANFTPGDFGLAGNVYVFDPRSGQGSFASARTTISTLAAYDSGSYRIIVPVSATGIAFIGDQGKLVPDGKKRIGRLTDDGRSIRAEVTFALNEGKVTLFGYSHSQPRVTASKGSVGPVTFDQTEGQFSFEVLPDPATQVMEGIDATRTAEVQIAPGS